MAYEDNTDNAWEDQPTFGEQIGNEESLTDQTLSPEEEAALSEDMSSMEGDLLTSDGLGATDDIDREYSDEDNA